MPRVLTTLGKRFTPLVLHDEGGGLGEVAEEEPEKERARFDSERQEVSDIEPEGESYYGTLSRTSKLWHLRVPFQMQMLLRPRITRRDGMYSMYVFVYHPHAFVVRE